MRNLGWVGLFVLSVSCLSATALAQSAPEATLSPRVAAEVATVHAQRDLSVGLWASGGLLMTAGGFGTLGYAFPGNGFMTLVLCGGAALVGLGLLIAAAAVGIGAHSRWQRLRDAGIVLAPDGVTLRF